jgi:hypothetical protein
MPQARDCPLRPFRWENRDRAPLHRPQSRLPRRLLPPAPNPCASCVLSRDVAYRSP